MVHSPSRCPAITSRRIPCRNMCCPQSCACACSLSRFTRLVLRKVLRQITRTSISLFRGTGVIAMFPSRTFRDFLRCLQVWNLQVGAGTLSPVISTSPDETFVMHKSIYWAALCGTSISMVPISKGQFFVKYKCRKSHVGREQSHRVVRCCEIPKF